MCKRIASNKKHGDVWMWKKVNEIMSVHLLPGKVYIFGIDFAL